MSHLKNLSLLLTGMAALVTAIAGLIIALR
jgi:hypothetical protein